MRPHFRLRRSNLPLPHLRAAASSLIPPTPVLARHRIIRSAHLLAGLRPAHRHPVITGSCCVCPPVRAMASLTLCPTDSLLKLITDSFPSLSVSTTVSESAQISSIRLPSADIVSGTNTITTYLAPQLFPNITYSDVESAEIGQWLTVSALNQDVPTQHYLETLNKHLQTRTTILGDKPSVADVAVYVRLTEHVRKWSGEVRTGGKSGGWRYIVRWLDYVQNAPEIFGIRVPDGEKVKVDVDGVKTVLKSEEPAKEKKEKEGAKEKEKKGGKVEEVKEEAKKVVEQVKKVAEAAGAAAPQEGGKKEKAKKEKAPKAPAPKKEGKNPLSPSLIDLRVGRILKCVPHPNADSLYMSTIVCGDTPDSPYINQPYPDPSSPELPPTRTVLSGLRGKVPIEEMQNRLVVLVCNLKPANMRGIKSSAMVLAASPRSEDPHGGDGKIELVEPPVDAEPGERVFFEGYGEGKPEAQLSPKQKIFEAVQPGWTTSEAGEVLFDGGVVFTGAEGEVNDKKLNKGVGKLVTEKGGVCKVRTLVGAMVR
ncbi:hypothetical protein BDZ91DRAFT_731655 [Kalaharituber pfeilii]|nr:hypothetical protein BDZ91DRAFT_731655 [Kalaharituber pfeilii]